MYHDFVVIYTNNSGISQSLSNVKDITIQRSQGSNGNSCDIILTNIDDLNQTYGEIKFLAGEELAIYASRDEKLDITNQSHLIGKYLILDYDINANTRTLKIPCQDRTFFMLNKIYVYRDDQDRKVDYIINDIIQVINENGSVQEGIVTNIASTKSNGLPFDTVSFVSDSKTAFEAIQELSQPDMTGDDKAYQFWFDGNGVFNWGYPSNTIEQQVLSYCDYPVYELQLNKPETESAKMIIYNAGRDLEDKVVKSFHYNNNASAVAESMINQPMIEINAELRNLIKYQYGLADTENATLLTVMTNTQFTEKLTALVRAKCDRIFANIGTGLWSATVRVFGDNYQVGGLYTIVCKNVGFIQREMRLERITHYLNSSGWLTTLELQEEV